MIRQTRTAMHTPEKSAQWLMPWATLTLLLAAAGAILFAGAHFARRTETVGVAADRGPLNIAADSMQRELARLERLYEGHLLRIGRDTIHASPDSQGIWTECNNVVGVAQWSLIHADPKAIPDRHIAVDLKQAGRMPEPAFRPDSEGVPHPQVILSAEDLLLADGQPWGWIDEPGKPLLFWLRDEARTSAVVLLIDRAQLNDVLKPWIDHWGDHRVVFGFSAASSMNIGAFSPLIGSGPRPTGNRADLRAPDGNVVFSVNEWGNPGVPALVLPIRSRFGTWQFELWGRQEARVYYDTRTQMAAGALAVLVALMGILGFVQQRGALALAAQRVSFVNRVSHELRTPLTNILLNLDLAADTLDESAREPLRRFSLVREEAHRLGRLIENALTFSRKQHGPLKIEPRACVPADAIRAVVDQFAPSFARRALVVRCTGDIAAPCLLDGDAFAQILSNLLSNVEKYVPGGIVEIASRLENNALIVTVTDEGPGIAPREAERIFQPFERLDSRINEGASGTGLGLAIARDLAIAAAGSLRLVPSARGASFELRLPAPSAPGIRIVSAA